MTAIITPFPQYSAHVPGAGGDLQVRTKAWQAKIAVAQNEHFAGHQEKPSARYDIIEFQTSPIAPYGSSSSTKRCHALKRYRRAPRPARAGSP